ncbi:MAG: hypothetical protein A4E73_03290 [Syntrophaceae bacterium PtaU1.Bin231]|nr:MAG: hypothetical protein A4E73_03290 [Syntrophaceae bacterium PtaU1.Bin231]HOG17420.1 hypothetical protein [Syntrophales bacterium]
MPEFSRATIVAALLTVLALAGCADFRMRGSFQADREISRSFERFEFRPELNYYSSGSDAHPNAMLGLNKEYTLESDLWKQIEKAEALKEMVRGMQKKAAELHLTLHGFRVLDNEGRAIGIWYAIPEARAALVMKGEKRVLVYTPDTGTYMRYEQEPSSDSQ